MFFLIVFFLNIIYMFVIFKDRITYTRCCYNIMFLYIIEISKAKNNAKNNHMEPNTLIKRYLKQCS